MRGITTGGGRSGGARTQGAPIRLTILRDDINWSGGTIQFLNLLPWLDPDRVAVDFCVLTGPAPDRAAFEARGITPVFFPRRWHDPFALRRAARRIRDRRADLLHLSGARAMLVGRAAARLRRVPAVLSFNNCLPEPRWRRWAQRRLAASTAAAVAVSRATADWAARSYRLPRSGIDVQYSTPDLKPFLNADPACRARIRAGLGIDREARVVVQSGRVLDALKGQFGMLRVFPEVLARVPEAHLLIVGEGPDLEPGRALARDLGIAERVTLAGRRDDMPDLLTACDVAVVPSRCEEAFGYVAVEASACGLPVVAFRAGGLPEAVRDGKTGLLVERGDWSGLARTLVRCLDDAALARRLGDGGRVFAAAFSQEEQAEEFMRFHEAVARGEIIVDGSP